ncbi:MAG: bifunctional glutamate N-acetyltransferase/amino-acid acetyltransferase ArgJ [Pseudomonadota bacterium]
MAVGRCEFPEIREIKGVRLGAADAGLMRTDRDDLVAIELAPGSRVAAVFTRNAFCAAPVLLARKHLSGSPRWLLVNSGNANAGTGEEGLDDALATCSSLAELVDANAGDVLPFSTGVIGEPLPAKKITRALPAAIRVLSADGWAQAATAIMTTDTFPKGASRSICLAGRVISISGIAKGAGMIHPDMATMLAFVATDAAVDRPCLQQCLERVVNQSFNRITVDGDTSTNDACVLMATGASGGPDITADSPEFDAFAQAVSEVCGELAESIVRDGEGATKLIRICVEGAASEGEAHQVAKTIAHSPLVKTAFFASDPNWGRILAAVGRAGIDDLDISRVSIWLDDVSIVQGGGRAPGYSEAAGQAVMAAEEIVVRVCLGRGDSTVRILTCDFSYDYVRINAEYRT